MNTLKEIEWTHKMYNVITSSIKGEELSVYIDVPEVGISLEIGLQYWLNRYGEVIEISLAEGKTDQDVIQSMIDFDPKDEVGYNFYIKCVKEQISK